MMWSWIIKKWDHILTYAGHLDPLGIVHMWMTKINKILLFTNIGFIRVL
jgi:hypothetical protein